LDHIEDDLSTGAIPWQNRERPFWFRLNRVVPDRGDREMIVVEVVQ